MAANFPLSFRNDTLRKWRRRILVEREKATLPAMQEFVEHRREAQKAEAEAAVLRSRHQVVYDAYVDASNEYTRLTTLYRNTKERVQILKDAIDAGDTTIAVANDYNAANTQRKAYKVQLVPLKNTLDRARAAHAEVNTPLIAANQRAWQANAAYDGRAGARRGEAKREFIMKCPDEGCRGFLSSSYKCGTCEKWTCVHCMDVLGLSKDVEHTCNKDSVETAKAIKSETRPCPKCGTRIFKIDGCDQMYCTMDGCGTAFSWNTGQIETGRVHNPHYYEWLRRTGGGQAPRELGDIPCGGMPTAWNMIDILTRNRSIPIQDRGAILETHRYIEELVHQRLADFRVAGGPLLNKDVDVRYLMQEMDEAEWRRQLEFTEAKNRRKADIGSILQMATAAAADIFRRIPQELPLMPEAVGAVWLKETVLPELEQLREFVNTSFKELAKRQHMAVPQLGEFWRWQPLRALYRAAAGAAGGT
jgi:transposase-like protein